MANHTPVDPNPSHLRRTACAASSRAQPAPARPPSRSPEVCTRLTRPIFHFNIGPAPVVVKSRFEDQVAARPRYQVSEKRVTSGLACMRLIARLHSSNPPPPSRRLLPHVRSNG